MSKGELRRKLIMKGEPSDAADDAVEYLAELGFIDEAQYAEDVARHYSAKGYNKWRVKQELNRHLVPREFWETALENFPEPEE
jgi:regulatory protein